MFKINTKELQREIQEKMARLSKIDEELRKIAPVSSAKKKKLFWIESCDPREWEPSEEESLYPLDLDLDLNCFLNDD